jgi:hypothetical protein
MHTTRLAPVQAPAWQLSFWVHALPSEQALPFGRVGVEHVPVAGSHVPASWHGLSAAHTTGLAPVQVPCWHVSVRVHGLPSLQAVPSLALVPVQAPLWQLSPTVQASPSSHGVALGFAGVEHMPVPGSQVPATWH